MAGEEVPRIESLRIRTTGRCATYGSTISRR